LQFISSNSEVLPTWPNNLHAQSTNPEIPIQKWPNQAQGGKKHF